MSLLKSREKYYKVAGGVNDFATVWLNGRTPSVSAGVCNGDIALAHSLPPPSRSGFCRWLQLLLLAGVSLIACCITKLALVVEYGTASTPREFRHLSFDNFA